MNHKRTLTVGVAVFAVLAAGLSLFSHAQDEPGSGTPAAEHEGHEHEGHDHEGHAHDAVAPEADEDHISYALGFRIGSDFASREIELDAEQFARGLGDALDGKEPRLGEQELVAALMAFQMQMQAKQQEQLERLAEQGRAFLEQNRDAEGVQVTDSGLQYKIVEPGEGEAPGPTDTVTVHYRGRLVDGQQFDSSYDHGEPAQFRADQVIPGWTEALQMMKPGAKWELYIPANLAYGQQGTPNGSIPPNATLIFEVELLGVEQAGE